MGESVGGCMKSQWLSQRVSEARMEGSSRTSGLSRFGIATRNARPRLCPAPAGISFTETCRTALSESREATSPANPCSATAWPRPRQKRSNVASKTSAEAWTPSAVLKQYSRRGQLQRAFPNRQSANPTRPAGRHHEEGTCSKMFHTQDKMAPRALA